MRPRFKTVRADALGLLLCVLPALFIGPAFPAESVAANPFEETIGILEDRTVFHWGRDCLVWIVHYPEELIDPWVEAEAGRAGMTESEREAYRKGFVSELSFGAREPFLFTVYAFGPRPLSFSPFSEKVALVTAGGERVKPVRYDKALDMPINGIAQGLVFFPKQKDRDFAVAVRGMGVHDERIFSFAEFTKFAEFIKSPPLSAEKAEEEVEEEDVVVLELPPKPSEAPKARADTPPRRQAQAPQRIERPALPSAPPAPVVIGPKTGMPEAGAAEAEGQSMAEFVEAMRVGDRGSAPPAEGKAAEQNPNQNPNPAPPDSAYVSREKTVRDFLSLWTKNDLGAMYAMLSESSRKLFSKETFESDLRKASDFRAALRDGYTLEWLGTERAKVTAVKRILLIRTLVARTLGVTREGAAWKIVW